jgi:GH15 family glucan-1,4-alpha-glucosidase
MMFWVTTTNASTAPQLAPHSSHGTLSWSNGVAASWYDTSARKIAGFAPALFAEFDSGERTPNLMYDAYPGLRIHGVNTWMTSKPVTSANYDQQRGIIQVVQRIGDVELTQWLWNPYGISNAAMVWTFDVKNVGTTALSDSSLFVLINAHLGASSSQTQGEQVRWVDNAFRETGAQGAMIYRPSPAPRAHATSPDNPFIVVRDGGRLSTRDDSGVRDDAVVGFEWDLAGLAAGASQHAAVVLAHVASANVSDVDRLATTLASLPNDGPALLAQERAQWDTFFSAAKIPAGLSADELTVYRQSMAILRMGQVRSDNVGGDGQVVASLPPGMWNTSWTRDQSYAVEAMVESGMVAQARAALDFWWRPEPGRGNWVCCDRDGGPWVGKPYQLSVVRYTGSGAEQSDENGNGPNIEFDGFGLALAATERYVTATGDVAMVSKYHSAIFERTADVVVSLIETQGAAKGLIRADSSIWETHWYNGGRQRTTFTQASAVYGLDAAARLADRLGEAARAARYRAASAVVRQAMVDTLVDPQSLVLRASFEQTQNYLDAAAMTAFLWDAIALDHPSVAATVAAFDAGLRNQQTGHGYRRNDDGGDYDLREWVSVDLWLAQLAYRRNDTARADALVQWVTSQARLNFDLLPENYDRVSADYQGEVPMTGFGAGAYISTLARRAAMPTPPHGTDMDPDVAMTSGCGCRSGVTGSRFLLQACLALIAMVALRRRRRA